MHITAKKIKKNSIALNVVVRDYHFEYCYLLPTTTLLVGVRAWIFVCLFVCSQHNSTRRMAIAN